MKVIEKFEENWFERVSKYSKTSEKIKWGCYLQTWSSYWFAKTLKEKIE